MSLTTLQTFNVDQEISDDVVLRLRTSLSDGDVEIDPSVRLTGWVLLRDVDPAPTKLRARVSSTSHAGAQVIDLQESPRVHERFPDAAGSDRAKFEIPLGSILTRSIRGDGPFEVELLTGGESRELISRWVFRRA